MSLTASDVERFEAARPRLEAIAYRLLGSAAEAEDAVQETFLRWQAADAGQIEVLEAWLTKVLGRRRRREDPGAGESVRGCGRRREVRVGHVPAGSGQARHARRRSQGVRVDRQR
jgi:hypothetical protein